MIAFSPDREDMPGEDFDVIVAVCKRLIAKNGKFIINLPNGCVLTNAADKIMQFPGIDFIMENHQKIMEIDATTPHILVMPSDMFNNRVKIGELFGMKVYADPNCPKDKFLIEQAKEDL